LNKPSPLSQVGGSPTGTDLMLTLICLLDVEEPPMGGHRRSQVS